MGLGKNLGSTNQQCVGLLNLAAIKNIVVHTGVTDVGSLLKADHMGSVENFRCKQVHEKYWELTKLANQFRKWGRGQTMQTGIGR